MKTIVIYTSQTGFTKKYAEWIGERLSAEVMTLKEAKKKSEEYFDDADAILYGGWAMAGKVNSVDWYMKKADAWKEKKLAIFCVGGSPMDNPDVKVWLENAIPEDKKEYIKPFYLQGGMNYEQMNMPARMMMKAFSSSMKKNKNATEKERIQAEWMSKSYDISDVSYIEPIVEYVMAECP